MTRIDRRQFLRASAFSAGVAALGPGFWARALTQEASAGAGPYGPLRADPDENGLFLPEGFRSRIVAVGGAPVADTGHRWHAASDGAGTFATPDGGWILTSNSEVGGGGGGVGALVFGPPDGDGPAPVVDAYLILSGTSRNCAGGQTPWGTWLSCEEVTRVGRVWECDPTGATPAVPLDLLGSFSHEAAAVDPPTGQIYLTEDQHDSRLFRFTPDTPPAEPGARPDLDAGVLEVAAVGSSGDDTEGPVTWVPVDPGAPTSHRPAGTRSFTRNEGIWYHADHVYFCATSYSEVYDLDLRTQELTRLYGGADEPRGALTDADNVTVHAPSGDLYVAEDSGNLELVLLAAGDAGRDMAPFARIHGHGGSEVTGPVFDPSGSRLYFASQRGSPTTATGDGVIYEVTGPFRRPSPPTTTTTPTTATPATAAAAPPATGTGDEAGSGPTGDDREWVLAGVAGAAALTTAGATARLATRRRAARPQPPP